MRWDFGISTVFLGGRGRVRRLSKRSKIKANSVVGDVDQVFVGRLWIGIFECGRCLMYPTNPYNIYLSILVLTVAYIAGVWREVLYVWRLAYKIYIFVYFRLRYLLVSIIFGVKNNALLHRNYFRLNNKQAIFKYTTALLKMQFRYALY